MSKLNIALIDENMGFIPETKIEKRGNKYEGYSFEELKVIIDEKKQNTRKNLTCLKNHFLIKKTLRKDKGYNKNYLNWQRRY